jgi:hypothetical protein
MVCGGGSSRIAALAAYLLPLVLLPVLTVEFSRSGIGYSKLFR